MGKYLVKTTSTGIKFDLLARNGEVIATSEVYSSEAACMNGIESVRTNAPSLRWRTRLLRILSSRSIRSSKCMSTRRASIASV